MKKLAAVVLMSVVWISLVPGLAQADGMILPLPDEGLTPAYLAVRYHHVEVSIEDGHAVTRVEQEFYNPYDFAIEGRYLFPVPPDAVLSAYQATVDGQRQHPVRQGAAQTNAHLYAVIAQQRDPSLLQYADWDSLAFDILLEPGQSKVMKLEYEQVLVPNGGLYGYRYVLSTERYSSLPLDAVSVTVEVRTSSGLASLYSPSHDATIERLGQGWARATWRAEGITPDQDFELYYAPTEDAFGGGLLVGERDGRDHLLFLFTPEVGQNRTVALPKDIVFVIDRSGSMSGSKIEQARSALHHILDQLNEGDRFSIVSFDERLSILDPRLLPVEQAALRDVRHFVDQLSADGSTDLQAALQESLSILERSEARGATRMVVFLTDGLPTAGITDEARIARLVTGTNARLEASLHVFGVGYDVNTHLLDRLAADNSGTVTYVLPGENLEAALSAFYAQIANPVLTDVEVEFEGISVSDLLPHSLPDLFQGSSLLLAGRYEAQGDAAAIRVRGRSGAATREYVYHYDLAALPPRSFVPRLWATRQAGLLLDRVRVEGEAHGLVEEIRDLGLAYGIVTPYTAFAIEGQSGGAASAENMALYGRSDLNDVSGETTIQARVQNLTYQQASQANLATGANVSDAGKRSLAQVGSQQVDLELLRGRTDLDGPISQDWIEANLKVDRTIEFASEEYFDLTQDPDARALMQTGSNVVFEFQGEVVSVRDSEAPAAQQELQPENSGASQTQIWNGPDRRGPSSPSASLSLFVARVLWGALPRFLPVLALSAVAGLVAIGLAVGLLVSRHSPSA